ncbi:Flp family type IVb pilin [Nocardioides sp. JQ2195]|uniref:Flp family type IVb pilin n=1 Tax=Nocardioides sp. JQ2195 TaxID=2592334 RepID=UPI00197D906E|nr:Flp family type IVb pilin [Nocardioides sp. JQ2195]
MLEKFMMLMLVGPAKKDDEKGATATEYGLLVAFIAVVIIVAVTLFGEALNSFFQDMVTEVNSW